jgi:hypothetical protein
VPFSAHCSTSSRTWFLTIALSVSDLFLTGKLTMNHSFLCSHARVPYGLYPWSYCPFCDHSFWCSALMVTINPRQRIPCRVEAEEPRSRRSSRAAEKTSEATAGGATGSCSETSVPRRTRESRSSEAVAECKATESEAWLSGEGGPHWHRSFNPLILTCRIISYALHLYLHLQILDFAF